MMQRSAARTSLRVRRHHEFEDAFAELYEHPRQIATVHDVRFKDDANREEMGYGQGVLRDFIHAAVEGGFRPHCGLFTEDPETKTLHVLPYANPVPEEGDARPRFAFLGRLLGRAIQDGVLVDVPLPGYLRNGLLGRQNGFADLLSYDAGLYRHLCALRSGHYTEEQLEAMELTFTHSEQHLGQTFEVPLVHGGETTRVTRANALEYCHLLTDYLLNRRCGRQVRALQAGLFEVVPRERLKIFNAEELQTLIRGQENDIPLDVDDWRAHTHYSRWDANDPGIEVFWAAIRSMAPHEQRAVLKFATSAGRAPLLGFAQLQPVFTLERSGNNESYLPTAATCMCALRIPRYSTPEVAKTKLLQAATQCDTFEMS
uniref:HECT-type E3 ubiquitin transferase n=1 Tax=Neobodo designis TaxID=312471 RepID=A0A7S1MQ61_NEODS|mmetsp:Transcript_44883/g.138475  ORF Transcript_44883/g.138475 Transcript_44883/m.138475 type:complete len:372 (+) Transcript_44883:1284-2399(+)